MYELTSLDGVVFVDGKVIFLEEGAYYTPSIVDSETEEMRPLCPVPTLAITPADAEKIRQRCVEDTEIYTRLRSTGVPVPEGVGLSGLVGP